MLPLLGEALLEKQLSLPVAARKSPLLHLGHAHVTLTHQGVSPFYAFGCSPFHILSFCIRALGDKDEAHAVKNVENHTEVGTRRSVPLLSLDFERTPICSGRVTIQVC